MKVATGEIFDAANHQSCPARLVAGAQPLASFGMEVLVKEQEVTPMGIILELGYVTEHRPTALRILEKDPVKAPR